MVAALLTGGAVLPGTATDEVVDAAVCAALAESARVTCEGGTLAACAMA